MSNESNHLKNNIARLSKIITSGIYVTDYSGEGEVIFDAHGKQLSDYQMHMHIGAVTYKVEHFLKTFKTLDGLTRYANRLRAEFEV